MPGPAQAQGADPPSIVLVVTDDQRADTLSAMPTVGNELMAEGVTFTNAFASNPNCCPSRASILTGRYSHGTGIYANSGRHGGFANFDDSSTLATWLQAAGYRTALVGKYLNGYSGAYIPPGWDEWVAFNGPQDYFDYSLNENGLIRQYADLPADYSTDVLAGKASSFIRSASGPLFLLFTPKAPHYSVGTPLETTPAPRHAGAFAGIAPWRPPSYGEPDVSDKPPWISGRPPFTPAAELSGDIYRQGQLESLLAVDEALGEIIDALEESGRIGNTLIAFTSDNGLAWGEHRWFSKITPYEESIRVPLVIRYDPLTSGRTDGHLVGNVDLAPTLAKIAGVGSPGSQGKSLVRHLEARGGQWRRSFLLEHWGQSVPTYCGVRASRYAYFQYRGKHEELYDLASDPYQLENRSEDPTLRKVVAEFRTRLQSLCDPAPPNLKLLSPCLILGNNRRNVLTGTDLFDSICGKGGNDRIDARAGDDEVAAGAGDDGVIGGPGRDVISGDLGDDAVNGVDGRRDVIECGRGDDVATVDRFDVVRGCERVRRR